MKNLKSIAYLVGSLMVVACSAGDSSAGAPSDPATTVAPLKQASAQAVADAIALRDQLQADSHGDASVVAPGHRLVKIAKIHQRAVEEIEALMELAIADHNGTGGVAVKNTGGSAGSGGSGGSADNGTGAGGGSDVTTGDPDLDNMDDDLNDMDDDLDQEDDDLNPDETAPTPAPAMGMGGADAGAPAASDPCKCQNPGGGGSGGKPSAKPGGKGGGKPSGGGAAGGGKPSGGGSGASLQKLLDKLMKMLNKGASSPPAAKAKNPKSGTQAQAVQADLTALYKLLNDPLFKKWQKFGGAP